MGGRGSKSSQGKSGGGSAETQNSNAIKNQMIQDGLNSRIAGIRQKAENGTGNYSFKSASATSFENAKKSQECRLSKEMETRLYMAC